MDTYDVSKETQYLQFLQQHEQNLRNAHSRKGQCPRATKSRDEIIMQFMFRRMMADNRSAGSDTIRFSFVPRAYASCTTPLSDLKKVMIKDLTLETHHRGCYAMLKAVTPPDKMTGVMVIMEDEAIDVLMLQLYHQVDRISTHGHLTQGTVMIVKEPYLKVMSDDDYGIWVNHLSDIKFIPEHSDLVPLPWKERVTEIGTSANDWKVKGNKHFKESRYQLAIDW
ncbi:hypothetical protein BDV12DRAFT_204184 [Aspergillus spectabilis]